MPQRIPHNDSFENVHWPNAILQSVYINYIIIICTKYLRVTQHV